MIKKVSVVLSLCLLCSCGLNKDITLKKDRKNIDNSNISSIMENNLDQNTSGRLAGSGRVTVFSDSGLFYNK